MSVLEGKGKPHSRRGTAQTNLSESDTPGSVLPSSSTTPPQKLTTWFLGFEVASVRSFGGKELGLLAMPPSGSRVGEAGLMPLPNDRRLWKASRNKIQNYKLG